MEFVHKYRPKKLSEVIGQDQAVKVIEGFLRKNDFPHATLLTGPSGCGKTTIARSVRRRLKCGDCDFTEINAAQSRGIDTIREIQHRVGLYPMGGKSRVWLIDEAHKLTSDAQNALLKILEDSPKSSYFFLCSTDPTKLLRTIITRCTEIKIKGLGAKDLITLIEGVTKKEELSDITEEIIDKLVEVAEGSARKALVVLHQIASLEGEDSKLEAIQNSDARKQGIDLARLLIKPGVRWTEVSRVIKEIEDEPETIRRIVLGYASAVCLGGGKLAGRCYMILSIFRDHFYDEGKPGLVRAAFEVVHAK